MTVEHGNASNGIGATPVFVAYPAEYRSSEVMTFVVTGDGAVSDRIFGGGTPEMAKALSSGSLDSSWPLVE
jgi:hypothetical protein